MSINEEDENGIDREIIIFKRDKSDWLIWQRSSNAVGNSKAGGVMGDPFESIEVKDGILFINQSGGSSWKWFHTDKYRYQNNKFELIGYTSNYGKLCEYWESFDFNIITGKIIINKEYEKCDEEGDQEIYRGENEIFSYKLKERVTLNNRNKVDINIVSPKYKHELYL